ncbi:hypothetical protein ONV78_00910 [Hahella sp. CR1]|uniref:hypothetical protein n=1 Tax=Hahella sp. CR1 TaxID=2992807 RepID=UPI0024434E63|nr:hypothetical protein [Hahella sp. CR1]MDG9666272.1 hypothetical protein [Hahella sp. CR1]
MVYLNRSLLAIAVFLAVIKVFTAVIFLADDPSVFLVVGFPLFSNELLIQPEQLNRYYVLLADENGFVGEHIYYLIVNYAWWLTMLSALALRWYTKSKSQQTSS